MIFRAGVAAPNAEGDSIALLIGDREHWALTTIPQAVSSYTVLSRMTTVVPEGVQSNVPYYDCYVAVKTGSN